MMRQTIRWVGPAVFGSESQGVFMRGWRGVMAALLVLAPLPPGEHEVMVHVELEDGRVMPDKVLRLTVVP